MPLTYHFIGPMDQFEKWEEQLHHSVWTLPKPTHGSGFPLCSMLTSSMRKIFILVQ